MRERTRSVPGLGGPLVKPHDVPSTGELVEAVREWLQSDVLAATDGRLQYHTRVAINVLSIVERELALGVAHEEAHLDRLRSLGVADDAELAAAIRSGELDDRLSEIRALVWESVRDKLAVANPKYLTSP
ncbi:MAG: hypothetical protein JJD93_11210 [Ilumatobacteraceae bacterium]|nr:hypothetical protein [Ilumatobacteraceae bacterium]